MLGQRIRIFFRELFGSRVVETLNAQIETMRNDFSMRLAEKEVLHARLEEDLLRLRGDFETRLQDKDQIIADVRAEKAALEGKVFLYETTLLPLASRAGASVVAAGKPKEPSFARDFNVPPMKSRWQTIQEEHDKALQEERAQDEKRSKEAVNQAAALGGANG